MKTLQPNGQLSEDKQDAWDGYVKPSKQPRAAWYGRFDGIHVFFDKGDGATVIHIHKPIADIFSAIQACDATLCIPKPTPKPKPKTP